MNEKSRPHFGYTEHLIAPCKGCEDRIQGCHADCQRYLSWKEEKASANEKVREYARKHYQNPHHIIARQAFEKGKSLRESRERSK